MTEMTPSESLQLIENMIGQAKRSFHRMSFYFLLWGVLLIAAMIANVLLATAGNTNGGIAWGVAGILGGVLSSIHGSREGRRQQAHGPMDRPLMWLWTSFVITMLTMIVAGAAGGQDPGPAIVVLTGLPTFLTGQMVRFKPLIYGGILFWAIGAVSYFAAPITAAALYVVAMLFGYIVPGLMLKRQENALRTA